MTNLKLTCKGKKTREVKKWLREVEEIIKNVEFTYQFTAGDKTYIKKCTSYDAALEAATNIALFGNCAVKIISEGFNSFTEINNG